MVHAVKGRDPVHKVGGWITIERPKILLDKTYVLCTHALPMNLYSFLILVYPWCPSKVELLQ